ncbi:MAG TPA: xanthine dehydrogenase family protein subunit M [Candidatus Limnocylindrales bacterium]|nr:xanthine dehydrogenase family protein subunit M [Candidatus Limnocylindrales bacterium]
MPHELTFHQPETLAEAIRLLDELGDEAKVVAGATALTIMLRQRLIAPAALVSLNRIPDLDRIEERDGQIALGALVRHRDVELDPLVRERLPLLAEVFAVVANVRVRNAATVGGVLAESDYASDPPAVFLALDAEVDVAGPNGARSIPIGDFFVAFYETAIEPAEIVTGVRVPIPPAGSGGVYEKYVTRSSEDRPCVGVAAVVRLAADGTAADVRVAVGAAAETPQRFGDLEAAARGRRLEPDVLAAIADGYAERIETLDDMRGSAWYRTEMVRVWVRRAIEHAAGRAGGAPAS